MIIELHAYVCDGCGQHSTSNGFTTLDMAWSHAKRLGWQREEQSLDGTGHVAAHHYCGRCVTKRAQLAQVAGRR